MTCDTVVSLIICVGRYLQEYWVTQWPLLAGVFKCPVILHCKPVWVFGPSCRAECITITEFLFWVWSCMSLPCLPYCMSLLFTQSSWIHFPNASCNLCYGGGWVAFQMSSSNQFQNEDTNNCYFVIGCSGRWESWLLLRKGGSFSSRTLENVELGGSLFWLT